MNTPLTTAVAELAADAQFHLHGAETALLDALRALEQSPEFDPDQGKRQALTSALEALHASA